jgi:hypothetical protein
MTTTTTCVDLGDAEEFSESGLRSYYNEFHAVDEPESGKPMMDGIRAVRQSLTVLDEHSVVILLIG